MEGEFTDRRDNIYTVSTSPFYDQAFVDKHSKPKMTRKKVVEPVEPAIIAMLTDAIEKWILALPHEMQYAHGNAQGITRCLAVLRATTFADEWETALVHYQNRITVGEETT